ncbi:Reverse transcriptase zinc-binding domain [Macleaya cordata]|uniref:Reverse transcriptase zinc-binding domain n=1 Tax=Macleaya cordata TaxID=56857 RepID=A0A200PMG8_MACCD|nr:Reverse transcriptase zinc-binding domain [Macleaya cordata]
MSRKQSAFVKDLRVIDESGLVSWDLDFIRRIWEEDLVEIADFTTMLNTHVLTEDEDPRIWTKEKKGSFTLSSCYDNIHKGGMMEFPHKEVWVSDIPMKICFFVWQVFHDSVPTMDNLSRKGMININKCEMCCKDLETVDHLLYHCSFTIDIWDGFLLEFGVRWAFRKNVKNFFAEGDTNYFLEAGNFLWKALPFTICWVLWNERNQLIFEGKAKVKEKIVLDIKALMMYWASPLKKLRGFHFEDLVFN